MLLTEFDFSRDASSAASSIMHYASKAVNAIAAHHELKKDSEQAEQDQALADQANAEQEKEDEEEKQKQSALSKAKTDSSRILLDLLLDREDPSEQDMQAFDDFDPDTLVEYQQKIDEYEHKALQLPNLMKAALKSSDFLDAADRTDNDIKELLADIDDSKLQHIEVELARNGNGEGDAWRFMLTSDDNGAIQKRYLQLLTRISKKNEAKNLAGTGGGSTKLFYVGGALVKVLRGELQILERRIAILKELFLEHGNKVELVQHQAAKAHSALNTKSVTDAAVKAHAVVKDVK